MPQLFRKAVKRFRPCLTHGGDELARILLQLAGSEQALYDLSPEEEAYLDASLAEAERGEFATNEEVRFRR